MSVESEPLWQERGGYGTMSEEEASQKAVETISVLDNR
jgi:hypothetical protein